MITDNQKAIACVEAFKPLADAAQKARRSVVDSMAYEAGVREARMQVVAGRLREVLKHQTIDLRREVQWAINKLDEPVDDVASLRPATAKIGGDQ